MAREPGTAASGAGQESPQLAEHEARVLEDVAVGVATVVVAAVVGLALPAAIALPGVTGLVEAVAIELYGQPVLGPAAVNAAGTGNPVGLGKREAVLTKDLEKSPLEPAEGDADPAAENKPEIGRPPAVGAPSEHGFDLARARLVVDARLVARPSKVVEGKNGCEIDERPRNGRDRIAAEAGRITRIDRAGLTGADAREMALARRQDRRRRRPSLDQPVMERSRPAAEQRVRSTG